MHSKSIPVINCQTVHRQSGDFEFKIGDIMNDAKVLKEAAQAADLIENNQVEVTDEEKEILKYQDTGIINI